MTSRCGFLLALVVGFPFDWDFPLDLLTAVAFLPTLGRGPGLAGAFFAAVDRVLLAVVVLVLGATLAVVLLLDVLAFLLGGAEEVAGSIGGA